MTTVEEVTNYTKAGGGCQSCHMRIEEIIDEVWVDLEKCGVPRPGFTPTPIQGIKINVSTEPAVSASGAALDEATLKSPIYDKAVSVIKEVAEGLKKDGSDAELVAISGDTVTVKLSGAVAVGLMQDMTLSFIAKKLTEAVGHEVKAVVR